MATGQEIAEFYAKLKIKVDPSEIRKMDSTLRNIERRLAQFAKNIKKAKNITIDLDKFNVNQKMLDKTLGDAVDRSSKKIVFEVSRFAVNERNLQAAMLRAFRGMGNGGGFAFGNQISGGEFNRRRAVMQEEARIRHERSLELARMRNEGRLARRAAMGAGGASSAGMLLGRALPIGLALAGGGYGLSQMNERNQAIVAAELQTRAVVQQAGGTPQQGQQSFDWLRAQGNRIGFNYLDAAQEYNTLLANFAGAGMSISQGQNVFKSFAELSRTFKLDRVKQQRVFLALSQIAGKGQLQSQELKLQLGQALPGAEGYFAQAWQQMTGGKLTGQASIAALLDAMKKGQVKADILNAVAPIISEAAAKGGLTTAQEASAAQQARFQNRMNDLSMIASNGGLEEGFSRLFKTLNDALSEADPIVKSLAEDFNEVTKKFREWALVPQSFQRMLEGKDSYVASILGKEGTDDFKNNIKAIKENLDKIVSAIPQDSLVSIDSTIKEIAAIVKFLGEKSGYVGKAVDTVSKSFGVAQAYDAAFYAQNPNPTVPERLRTALQGSVLGTASYFLPQGTQDDIISYYMNIANGSAFAGNTFKYPVNAGNIYSNISSFVDPVAAAASGWGMPDVSFSGAQQALNMQNQASKNLLTNSTTTVTVGDIIINSSATTAQGFGMEIQEATRQALHNAFSDANMNTPRFGK